MSPRSALRTPGALDVLPGANPPSLSVSDIQCEPHDASERGVQGAVVTIEAFLAERADRVRGCRHLPRPHVIDPGLGFGKTWNINLTLLRQLSEMSGWVSVVSGFAQFDIGALTFRDFGERTRATCRRVGCGSARRENSFALRRASSRSTVRLVARKA